MAIAVLGGTGPEGVAIAARLLATGNEVIIGSRAADRAASTAATLAAEVPGGKVRGARNPDAAAAAEMIVVAGPRGGRGCGRGRERARARRQDRARGGERDPPGTRSVPGQRPRHPRRAAPASPRPDRAPGERAQARERLRPARPPTAPRQRRAALWRRRAGEGHRGRPDPSHSRPAADRRRRTRGRAAPGSRDGAAAQREPPPQGGDVDPPDRPLTGATASPRPDSTSPSPHPAPAT